MKRISILIILSIIPLLLFAQKTKLKKVKYSNSKILKEEYQVLRKNKYIKHGEYLYYFENGVIKETGYFSMNKKNGKWEEFNEKGKLERVLKYNSGRKIEDKKFGIWLEYHEKGKVITGFDYEKNERLETIINVPIDYPPLAREKGIQGIVKVKIKLNPVCEIENIELVEGIGYGCDKEVLKRLKKYYELLKKYDSNNCIEIDEIIAIQFQLK